MVVYYYDGKQVQCSHSQIHTQNNESTMLNPRDTSCVSCGEETPEGTQVCLKCMKGEQKS